MEGFGVAGQNVVDKLFDAIGDGYSHFLWCRNGVGLFVGIVADITCCRVGFRSGDGRFVNVAQMVFLWPF